MFQQRGLWFACVLVALVLAVQGRVHAQEPGLRAHLYILSFNRWGELRNPAERDLAVSELKKHEEIERIVIFSYGWAYDGESSYASYRSMLEKIEALAPADRPRIPTAVIAIGWDSSQTGFRKLFNNVIPFPGIANALAWLPDRLLFPISFWSKSAQADRIGFGGLRRALNQIFAIYEGREDHPDIYLIGHSFGTRILSGLMKNQLGWFDVGSNPFLAAEHVQGAILLQPALVAGNLDNEAQYPVLVTMSRHDAANGFLYPIANLVLNAFGFTLFESLVQRRVIDPVKQTAESVAGMVSTRRGEEPAPELEAGRIRRTMHLGRRTLGELIALPLTLVFSLVTAPIDYAYIQTRALTTRPIQHILDTLAQLPIVEIPVDGLGRVLGRQVPWGQRSQGLFTIGPIHVPMGRMVTPRIFVREPPPVYSPDELASRTSLPRGVFSVDASDIVSLGGFGLDLANPLADYTIGWLDPIGAHSDYTNSQVVGLIGLVVNSGDAASEP